MLILFSFTLINTFTQRGFPPSIFTLENISVLDLEQNSIVQLPESVSALQSLQTLILAHNKLLSLPKTIGALTKVLVRECQYAPLGCVCFINNVHLCIVQCVRVRVCRCMCVSARACASVRARVHVLAFAYNNTALVTRPICSSFFLLTSLSRSCND